MARKYQEFKKHGLIIVKIRQDVEFSWFVLNDMLLRNIKQEFSCVWNKKESRFKKDFVHSQNLS